MPARINLVRSQHLRTGRQPTPPNAHRA